MQPALRGRWGIKRPRRAPRLDRIEPRIVPPENVEKTETTGIHKARGDNVAQKKKSVRRKNKRPY